MTKRCSSVRSYSAPLAPPASRSKSAALNARITPMIAKGASSISCRALNRRFHRRASVQQQVGQVINERRRQLGPLVVAEQAVVEPIARERHRVILRQRVFLGAIPPFGPCGGEPARLGQQVVVRDVALVLPDER